jgi:hypothetical protein
MTSLEAYNILLQRQMNEDRILAERTRTFLLANSFLFLAFVTLLNPDFQDPALEILRVALPIVGILLSALLYSANRAATNALAFWHGAQQKIELTDAEFKYMLRNGITPHIRGNKAAWGRIKWELDKRNIRVKTTGRWERLLLHPWLRPTNHYITSILFPLFFALWIAALVVAIVT